MITKQQMLLDRGDEYAMCDYCQQRKPTQMHELIYRSKTSRDSVARDLTYACEVCSLLCETCHTAIHHGTGINQTKLWQHNYRLYGYKEVIAAAQAIDAALKIPFVVNTLPEEL